MATSEGIALIAYDGSEAAARAIRQAGPLLAPRRALVLTVSDSVTAQLLGTEPGVGIRDIAADADREAETAAERTATEGADRAREAGFEADSATVRGGASVWRTLLTKADEINAPVVVLGSRGLGAVKSVLLGSVSSGTLHHSDRPVLVVPDGDTDRPTGPLILAFDGSGPARAAVRAAAELLTAEDALVATAWMPYTTVTAAGVAGAPAGVVAGGVERLDNELAERARQTAEEGAQLASKHGLDARAAAIQTDRNACSSLLRRAREQRAAALVVGSHGRGGIGAAVLGSVSAALVHQADRPVLVVPPRRSA